MQVGTLHIHSGQIRADSMQRGWVRPRQQRTASRAPCLPRRAIRWINDVCPSAVFDLLGRGPGLFLVGSGPRLSHRARRIGRSHPDLQTCEAVGGVDSAREDQSRVYSDLDPE